MKKSVAILLDGGFVVKKLPIINEHDIYRFALGCVRNETEELFRIFFYHCPPYEDVETHPITGESIDFKTTETAQKNRQILSNLAEMNHVACRKGRLAFRGWTLSKYKLNQLQRQATNKQNEAEQQVATGTSGVRASTNPAISADDFKPNFEQKEVDIKIGLDVAWLSSKSIVDKIVLVSADTDLVPAMKFARREGVQVIIVNIISTDSKANNYLKSPLKEHADEVRSHKSVPPLEYQLDREQYPPAFPLFKKSSLFSNKQQICLS